MPAFPSFFRLTGLSLQLVQHILKCHTQLKRRQLPDHLLQAIVLRTTGCQGQRKLRKLLLELVAVVANALVVVLPCIKSGKEELMQVCQLGLGMLDDTRAVLFLVLAHFGVRLSVSWLVGRTVHNWEACVWKLYSVVSIAQ